MPPWFLEHCVLASQELADRKIGLLIRDNDDGLDHSATCSAADQDANDVEERQYEVASAVYNPVLNLRKPSKSGKGSKKKRPGSFSHDAALLRFPDMHKGKGCMQFLAAVVERFAQDSGSDLITLGTDDFYDLAEHFSVPKPEKASMGYYTPESYPPGVIPENLDHYGLAPDPLNVGQDVVCD